MILVYLQRILPAKPCTQPIGYTLNTFDNRFGISKADFLNALSSAEAIWEKPFGKDLFTYAPQGGSLKINLIYDYRQQATSKLKGLGIIVKDDQASYDSLKLKYNALKTQYLEAKGIYDAKIQIFNQKNADYRKQIEYWNTHGGVPRKEYEELMLEQSTLKDLVTELQTIQAKSNNMVDEMNALVVVLNRLVKTLNLAVDQYNTIGASRGESFSEGLYQSDANGQEINIYEFSSRDKLVRVLAHELGHALGLDHVSDPKAIMYSFNSSTNVVPTPADIAELKVVCGVE